MIISAHSITATWKHLATSFRAVRLLGKYGFPLGARLNGQDSWRQDGRQAHRCRIGS
jgi:hypothetical protein